MKRLLLLIGIASMAAGCHSVEPAALSSSLDLKPNVGEIIRVEGVAHYLKATGPSIAAEGFEIRVYPRTAWGAELDGKRIQVIGRLNDSAHATPPDPSLNPGEYWLADSTWKPQLSEK